VELCQWILTQSTSAVSRFHAAVLLNDIAKSRWSTLDAAARSGPHALRLWVVHAVEQRFSVLQAFERREWLKVAAVLTRLAYPHEAAQSTRNFVGSLCEALCSEASPLSAKVVSAEFLGELVEEMDLEVAGAQQSVMDRLKHTNTRNRFVGDELPIIFSSAQAALNRRRPETVSVLFALLEKILGSYSGGNAGRAEGLMLDEPVDLRRLSRSSRWTEVSASVPALVRCMFEIYQLAKGSQADSEEILRPARQCLVLATGMKLPEPESRSLTLEVMQCLDGQRWDESSDAEERMAFASVVSRLFVSQNLGGSLELFQSVLQALVSRSASMMYRVTKAADENEWAQNVETRDILIETWSSAARAVAEAGGGCTVRGGTAVSNALSSLLKAVIESELEVCSHVLEEEGEEEDEELEDVSREEARYQATAILARVTCGSGGMQFVAEVLDGLARAYFEQNLASETPFVVVLERTYTVTVQAAYILADSSSGETPNLPREFYVGDPRQAVQGLFLALLQLVEVERSLIRKCGVHAEAVSPRVGAGIVSALARIAPTYLTPVESEAAATEAVLSREAVAKGRHLALCVAVENLICRYAEPQLADCSSELLLHLAQAVGLKSEDDVPAELRNEELWSALINMMKFDRTGQPHTALRALRAKSQRKFGQALVTAHRKSAPAVVDTAITALKAAVEHLSAAPSAADSGRVWLNILSGAAASTCMARREISGMLMLALQTTCGDFMQRFARNSPEATRDIIKFAERYSANYLYLLDRTAASQLLRTCIALCRTHVEVLVGQRQEFREVEVAASLAAILKLMITLLEKDALDFSEEANAQDGEPAADVDEATFFMLSLTMPLITDEIMLYPKVQKRFNFIVAELVRCHSERLCRLPLDFVRQLMYVLQNTLVGLDVTVRRQGFEAVSSLAKGLREAGRSSRPVEFGAEACALFMRAIIQGFVLGSITVQASPQASDALLDLISCDMDGSILFRVAHEVLEYVGDKTRGKELFEALARSAADALQSSERAALSHKRKVRSMFQEEVDRFSQQICTLAHRS